MNYYFQKIAFITKYENFSNVFEIQLNPKMYPTCVIFPLITVLINKISYQQ